MHPVLNNRQLMLNSLGTTLCREVATMQSTPPRIPRKKGFLFYLHTALEERNTHQHMCNNANT